MSRTFAYTRVSTAGQTTDNQVREIEQAKFDVPEFRRATEVISGSVPAMKRPAFAKLVEKMEPGDVLVVTKFDWLGRDAMDVEATIRMLAQIPVKVHCLAIQGIDLASSGGAFTMHVLNAVAQLERDLIIERTNSGIARARAQGKRFGRPPAVPAKKHPAILAALLEGQSVTSVARRFGTSRPTIARIRDGHGAAEIEQEEDETPDRHAVGLAQEGQDRTAAP